MFKIVNGTGVNLETGEKLDSDSSPFEVKDRTKNFVKVNPGGVLEFHVQDLYTQVAYKTGPGTYNCGNLTGVETYKGLRPQPKF